ncbi:hypothetical protein RhiJN_20158 [Ceratobasidium sp. AG-Ba]|nr:hypothetical protein RhiJN_20158 [Ceratobasidium sp. AG-Ba]
MRSDWHDGYIIAWSGTRRRAHPPVATHVTERITGRAARLDPQPLELDDDDEPKAIVEDHLTVDEASRPAPSDLRICVSAFPSVATPLLVCLPPLLTSPVPLSATPAPASPSLVHPLTTSPRPSPNTHRPIAHPQRTPVALVPATPARARGLIARRVFAPEHSSTRMPAAPSYAPRGQHTRNPNRQRPQRVQLFRNDNWPPRPPALDLPVPSFLTPQSPGSDTSLLRALPTPSFVSPADFTQAAMEVERTVETSNQTKTAPPPVPTKAVIAASAVPLADWFADVVWAIYLGRNSTVGTMGGNAGLAGADKAPQALSAFVHAVLSQTLASPQCAALGLYYLVRLPVNLSSVSNLRMGGALWSVGPDAEGHTCYASVPDRVGPGPEDVPYRLAVLALMLGNKWLDDHTFTNKTWHEVTHLPLARLTALEHRALECFNHALGVPNADWRSWLGVLRDEAAHANESVSVLAVEAMDRLERELDALVFGVGSGAEKKDDKGVIGDRRQSPRTLAQEMELDVDELEMEQVEIDIDLDDGGPVPEELRRPVKMRLGGAGAWEGAVERVDEWEKAVKSDKVDKFREHWLAGLLEDDEDGWLQWDRARDPPVERVNAGTRGGYEAVQRPGAGWESYELRQLEKTGKEVQHPGKKQLFADEEEVRVKGKKELFAVGTEYRGAKAPGTKHVPRVELYDAQLQDVRANHYTYDYPAKGAYYEMYESVPRDAMGYDSGLAYAHGYEYPGYEYAGHCYGASFVPRQVPVPVWVPQQQQHRGSTGCILS